MRPIDADALNKRLSEVVGPPWPDSALGAVNQCIIDAPTLDVVTRDPVRRKILKAAIRHYGSGMQRFKAIEELSELIRALARCDNSANIAEEMADVRIMLDQLEIIFHNRDQVRKCELAKLKRLSDRIHAADTVG